MADLTKGSIPRQLLRFSWPLLAGNLLQALYNTVDSIWVGQFLGSEALAAVSVSFPIIFALVSLIMGLTMATTVLVAQYYGAGQMEMVRRVVANSILLLGGVGMVVSVIGVLFRNTLLRLVNVPPEVLPQASTYLGVIFAGLLAMFIYNVASAILRGLGNSRTPLYFLAIATGINIILDPLLIFGLGPIPGLGVAGAALATVIAQGAASLFAVRYLYYRSGLLPQRREHWRFDRQLAWQTVKIGLPAGIQNVLVSLGMLTVSAIINTFGKTVVAGFGAAGRIDQFVHMPAMSIGLAVSTFVGQNLGAGERVRVREVVYWGNLLTTTITFVGSLVAFFAGPVLIRLFITEGDVVAVGANYLRYMAFGYMPMALMFSLGGVIRGAGDTTAPMVITILSLWAVRVPLAWYLSSQPHLGINGVWLASVISPLLGMALYYWYYSTGRWEMKAVVTKPVPRPTH